STYSADGTPEPGHKREPMRERRLADGLDERGRRCKRVEQEDEKRCKNHADSGTLGNAAKEEGKGSNNARRLNVCTHGKKKIPDRSDCPGPPRWRPFSQAGPHYRPTPRVQFLLIPRPRAPERRGPPSWPGRSIGTHGRLGVIHTPAGLGSGIAAHDLASVRQGLVGGLPQWDAQRSRPAHLGAQDVSF